MPSTSNERGSALVAFAAWLIVALAGCDDKKEEPESVEPPPPGGASSDVVATNIGTGLGLPADLAPTSTRWERVIVLDDQHAVVIGRAQDDAIALRTADAGRSWNALSAKAEAFARWNAAMDGSVALVSGPRKSSAAPAGKLAPVESAQLWIAPGNARLSEPAPFFPRDGALAGALLADGDALPAVLSTELVSLALSRGASSLVAFGAPVGSELPEPMTLPPGRWLGTPYGRPPQLLSVAAGGAIQLRPWPRPGEALATGSTIPGLRAVGGALDQLDRPPACESAAWSFTALQTTPRAATIVGISPTRSFAFAAPDGTVKELGCGGDALALAIEAEKKTTILRCTLDGQCAEPQSPAFEIWPEPHDSELHLVATDKGIVATLSAHAGGRWGNYLAQSVDAGKTFELPRVIGEGKTESGRFEIGALMSFPKRVVLLLSAEEGGTSRRRWYVLASDDAGSSWGPP